MKSINKKKAYNFYPIDQSPLYKINSKASLQKILCISAASLDKILSHSEKNYIFTSIDDRNLEIPKPQLKRVHNRINRLLSRISPPEYLMSGVKGRSNTLNAKVHKGHHALIKTDIKAYYQSTTTSQISRCFRKTFKCSTEVSEILAKISCVNGHIPTGSPISQSLSFFSNAPVFNHINIYSKSRGIRFTCYVDDLTFSGVSFPSSFLNYVSSYLKKNRDYTCHKTRRFKADTVKVVTGVVIKSDALQVRNNHRKKISYLLKKVTDESQLKPITDEVLLKDFQILTGHLFSAGQINGRYYQKGKEIIKLRNDLITQHKASTP